MRYSVGATVVLLILKVTALEVLKEEKVLKQSDVCDEISEQFSILIQTLGPGFESSLETLETLYDKAGCGTFLAFDEALCQIQTNELLSNLQKDVVMIQEECENGNGFAPPSVPGQSVTNLLGGNYLRGLLGICNKWFAQCYRQQLHVFSQCIRVNKHMEKCQCQFAHNLEKHCEEECHKFKKSSKRQVEAFFDGIDATICPEKQDKKHDDEDDCFSDHDDHFSDHDDYSQDHENH